MYVSGICWYPISRDLLQILPLLSVSDCTPQEFHEYAHFCFTCTRYSDVPIYARGKLRA